MERRGSKQTGFDKLIQELQLEQNQISIEQLVRRKSYDKRRLYDLLNILTTLGICAKLENKEFVWIGTDSVRDVILAMATDLELQCATTDDISVLQVDDNTHLSVIVTKFIQSFLYFGKNTINVQDIAYCMSQKPDRAKRILRRLYLITQILEEVGVVEHTSDRGKYKLVMDVHPIVKQAFRQLMNENKLPVESILSKMNDVHDDYIRRLHYARDQMLHLQRAQRDGSDESLSNIKMLDNEPVRRADRLITTQFLRENVETGG